MNDLLRNKFGWYRSIEKVRRWMVVHLHCYLGSFLGLRDPIIHWRSIIAISGWQKCASAMNLASSSVPRLQLVTVFELSWQPGSRDYLRMTNPVSTRNVCRIYTIGYSSTFNPIIPTGTAMILQVTCTILTRSCLRPARSSTRKFQNVYSEIIKITLNNWTKKRNIIWRAFNFIFDSFTNTCFKIFPVLSSIILCCNYKLFDCWKLRARLQFYINSI